ncbi:MAG: TMEM165/GDT1 family protein [Alphaproteobacteria bacterium]
MEGFLISVGVVAIAEIGDKTQLLALMLAARYRAPVSILLGILLATMLNHGLAAGFGAMIANWIGADAMRYILGVSFLAMAAWTLVPDKADDGPAVTRRTSAFLATLVSFFLVEIGDKTQIATIALAAQLQSIAVVAAGTTIGMMLANFPAVYAGRFASTRLPLRMIRIVAAALFAALGIAALLGLGAGIISPAPNPT